MVYYFLNKFEFLAFQYAPWFFLLLMASITLNDTVNSRAATEKINAAGIPVSLMIPNRKLFKPRKTPATKLGKAKNFFSDSNILTGYLVS